ncbi:hypothetical protein P5V15_001852 [Pogonomyrmex californicus]
MHNVDEFFRESCYSNLRILLIVCGIWPFQASNIRYAMYAVFAALFGFTIAFESMCTIEVWPDFFETFDCLTMLFYALSSTIKLIYTVYKLPKIKMLLVKIHEHWCSSKADKEAKILHSNELVARKFGFIYAGGLGVYTMIYVFTPLVIMFLYNAEDASNKTQNSETRDSTRHINYMIDLQMQYIPLYIQGSMCEIYFTIIIVAINILYLASVQHCCGLFAALCYHLENAFEFEDDDDIMTSTQNKWYLHITYGIRRHAEAIQFSRAIESLYRLPFFLHMTINVTLLSIVGFQVMAYPENISRMLPYGSYLSGLVFNTFFENWQGQKMIDCNEKVYNSAYKLEWYKMPIASQKLLIMIMLRSNKPLTITAGKVLVLSYVTFNAAMRTGFSYLMLLRSMQ